MKETVLYFNSEHDDVIRDYYLYVLRLLTQAAQTSYLKADVVLGAYEVRHRGSRLQFRVDFQIEHTLVKKGGRGAGHAPEGVVPVPGDPGRRYLVRVQDMARLDRADVVIEYSCPNLVNLKSSGLYPELVARLHYIAPLVYPVDALVPGAAPRDLEVITLFGNPKEPRRKALLDTLRHWNPVCQNIRGCFDDIHDIYRRTRILVNIRQTDHHDTLEELRVLPALLSGVVVISEDVPLRSEVPYRDFILWAPLQELPALVREVHESYAHHHERIFSGAALRQCLSAMEKANRDTARLLLAQLEARHPGS
ncbi:MAG: hypothetical protein WAY02_08205 [Burkholderiaceae bacterium]